MIKGLRGEPTREENCFMLNPCSGIQITMGHQTAAFPNVLFRRQILMIHIFSIVFISSLSSLLCINKGYFNEKSRMIRRKISKGETTCHNKPHFCFVKGNIAKMVMQSGICPFEAKNNIFSLANFFIENLLPRNVDIGVCIS